LKLGQGARALNRQQPRFVQGLLLGLHTIQATLVGEGGNLIKAPGLETRILLGKLAGRICSIIAGVR